MTNEETLSAMDAYFDANPEAVKAGMEVQQNIYAENLLENGQDIINDLEYVPTWWEKLKYRIGRVLG